MASSTQWTISTTWAAVFRYGLVTLGLMPQLRRGFFGARVELVVVVVEARQCADHVGRALEVGVLGAGVRHQEFVGHFQVALDGKRAPSLLMISPSMKAYSSGLWSETYSVSRSNCGQGSPAASSTVAS